MSKERGEFWTSAIDVKEDRGGLQKMFLERRECLDFEIDVYREKRKREFFSFAIDV